MREERWVNNMTTRKIIYAGSTDNTLVLPFMLATSQKPSGTLPLLSLPYPYVEIALSSRTKHAENHHPGAPFTVCLGR